MGVYTEMAVKHAADTVPFTEADSFQLALDIQRADHAMFEALIELDFGEVYQEMGILAITEAEEAEGKKFSIQAMKQKVIAAIDAIISLIKRAINTITEKWNQLMDRDSKIYTNYKDAFHKNIGSCNVSGIKVPDFDKLENLKEKDEIVIQDIIDIADADDVNTVNQKKDTVVERLKNEIKGISEKKKDEVFISGSDKKPLKDAVDAAKIDQYMKVGCRSFVKELKAAAENQIKYLEQTKKVQSSKVKDSDTGKAQISAINSIIATYNRLITTTRSMKISQAKTVYAAARKIWITVASGKQPKKSSDNEDQTVNASYIENLGTLSDLYVEEAFVF